MLWKKSCEKNLLKKWKYIILLEKAFKNTIFKLTQAILNPFIPGGYQKVTHG